METTVEAKFNGSTKINHEIFQRKLQTFLLLPEHFNTRSIVRADIVNHSSATPNRFYRKLIPKLKREDPNNQLTQLIINNDSNGYTCAIINCCSIHDDPNEFDSEQYQIRLFNQMQKQLIFPLVRKYTISLLSKDEDIGCNDDNNNDNYENILQMKISHFPDTFKVESDRRNHIPEFTEEYFSAQLAKLHSLMHKETVNGEYVKRVHHDLVIPKSQFQDFYYTLKAKICDNVKTKWVASGMTTNCGKHVHEDLGIAAFLGLVFATFGLPLNNDTIDNSNRFKLLFEIEEMMKHVNSRDFPFSVHGDMIARLANSYFVDMGCGNGLLCWLLSRMGIQGHGIDIWERPLWKELKKDCTNNISHGIPVDLRISKIIPSEFQVFENGSGENCDKNLWLIGNHSDELTPWIPLIAHKLCQDGYNCGFVIIPCCFHDLSGDKNIPGRWKFDYLDNDDDDYDNDEWAKTYFHGMESSRYSKYLSYIRKIACSIGFTVHHEFLRIPSTKNLAFIGTLSSRNSKFEEASELVCTLLSDIPFKCRLTDREKTLLHFDKLKLADQAAAMQESYDMENRDLISIFNDIEL